MTVTSRSGSPSSRASFPCRPWPRRCSISPGGGAGSGIRSGGRSTRAIWLRQTRHGRTGHDAPLLLVAGTQGFGFRHGEVWGIHLAWSGDASWWAERLPDGSSVLGAAELGEVVVEPGEEYATPWVYAAWSDEGLDGLSARLHRFIRSRDRAIRGRPRPVVLNTWEAVYFDHRLDRLKALADTAAELGVERFVLDDGWFRHRRDDTAGLGDWYVDEDVWPDGLHPLIDHVRAPRHGVRPVGRAGDGQPGLRPRPRAPRLGPRRPAVAQPASARHHDRRRPTRTSSSGSTRCSPSTTSPTSSGTTTATW